MVNDSNWLIYILLTNAENTDTFLRILKLKLIGKDEVLIFHL